MIQNKKIMVPAIVLATAFALHFIPVYAKTGYTCAIKDSSHREVIILGSSKARVDERAKAITDFKPECDDTLKDSKAVIKLYIL